MLSSHFALSEFECKCGCEMPAEVLARVTRLAKDIDTAFRIGLGMPVKIISGYRCRAHNKAVGGAANSRHILGDAADIQIQGLSGEWLAGYAEAQILLGVLPEGGVGTYKDKPATLHYDQRGKRARWRM